MSKRVKRPVNPVITNQELLDDLKRVGEENGNRYVSKLHYEKHGRFNAKTPIARFGSWSKALDQADLINHKDDVVGERFGMLKIVAATNEKKHNYWLWKCRCDCGEICYRTINALKSQTNGSCGCNYRFGASLKKPEEFDYVVQEGKEKHRHASGLLYINYLSVRSDNTTGYVGVTKYATSQGDKYAAELVALGKRYKLHGFKTADEAYEKGRLVLEKNHFPEDFRIELYKRRKEKEDDS